MIDLREKLEQSKRELGERWLLHPANRVTRSYAGSVPGMLRALEQMTESMGKPWPFEVVDE